MKKLLYLISILAVFISCSDDEKDDKFPIKGLEIPVFENPVEPGTTVTIKGHGFTGKSEIWFRAVTSRATGDVQATVTGVDDNGITFVTPGVHGKQSVLLKEDGEEHVLGEMTFTDEPGDVEILPKKIVSIKEIEVVSPSFFHLYEFTYNTDGTIAKMIYRQPKGADNETTVYTYTTGKITSLSDRNMTPVEEVYTLQGNKVIKFIRGNEKEDNDERYEYDYMYTGDLLTKIDGDNEGDDEDETFTRDANNNLSRYEYKNNNLENYNGSIDFTYNGQMNNLNIDFFYFISFIYFDCNSMVPCMLNVTGKRSTCLPSTMKYTEPRMREDNDEAYLPEKDITDYAFKYEMKDGYITKVTITNTTENKDEWIYEITYEE